MTRGPVYSTRAIETHKFSFVGGNWQPHPQYDLRAYCVSSNSMDFLQANNTSKTCHRLPSHWFGPLHKSYTGPLTGYKGPPSSVSHIRHCCMRKRSLFSVMVSDQRTMKNGKSMKLNVLFFCKRLKTYIFFIGRWIRDEKRPVPIGEVRLCAVLGVGNPSGFPQKSMVIGIWLNVILIPRRGPLTLRSLCQSASIIGRHKRIISIRDAQTTSSQSISI